MVTPNETKTMRPATFEGNWERPLWDVDGQPNNEEAQYIEDMELYAQALEVQLRAQPDLIAALTFCRSVIASNYPVEMSEFMALDTAKAALEKAGLS